MQPSLRALITLIIAYAAALSVSVAAAATVAELDSSYRFLVSERADGGMLNGDQPLSYIDSADYWGAYVCKLERHDCAVRDVYNSSDYSLTPQDTPAGDLQAERINVHNGSNIYDAATWQIAVMLGQVVNGFTLPNSRDAYELVSKQTQWLSDPSLRATTRGQMFVYNGQTITDARQAYAFRMVARDWLVDDPLKGSRYANLVKAEHLPLNPDYQLGKVSWLDWKPITGENAWALLIGPLQAAYLHYVHDKKQRFVPFDDLAVQNAIHALPTFAAMQSPLGAVYYAPAGTIGNQGKLPVNPYEVAIENNVSLYAGLNILQTTLRTAAANQTLNREDQAALKKALLLIDIMINGGSNASWSTAGLLSFFKNYAWHDGEFMQGGFANDPHQRDAWVAASAPKAVDVNTWGIAALGAARIDNWFGFGAAYKAWQQVKTWGGYGRDKTLWGVGYSDRDGNGMEADGSYRQGVLSAEWTAGAVNAMRNLQRHYQRVAPKSAQFKVAQEYLRSLRQDEAAMLQALQTLRFDVYQRTPFSAQPAELARLVPQRYRSYVYASRRYAIPFGWYANPLPSTCATAWMVMLADDFDPLSYAGRTN